MSISEEERFRGELDRSWLAVKALQEHYVALGYEVVMPAPRTRPNIESRAGYGDAYDLVVVGKDKWWQFEVKWRSLNFTDAADFGFDTVFVGRAEKVDGNAAHIHAYLSLNRALTHCLMIPAATKFLWTKRSRFDAKKGYSLTVYECPISLARFGRV
jgi:hypothetical protein